MQIKDESMDQLCSIIDESVKNMRRADELEEIGECLEMTIKNQDVIIKSLEREVAHLRLSNNSAFKANNDLSNHILKDL